MGKPTVGYWNFRGLCAPIRYLLHYKGVDFEDKRYPHESADAWFNQIRFSLGLDFPNLPYYIDGNVKLTQSLTILRYLAKKYGLEGDSEEEQLRVSLAEQQIIDFRNSYFRLVHSEKFESEKPEFLQRIPPQLKAVEAFLGQRKFLAGDKLTYVDFMAYDVFDFYRYLAPGLLDDFPTIMAYQERVQNLPELQAYFSSYKRWPILGVFATFGGKGPEPSR